MTAVRGSLSYLLLVAGLTVGCDSAGDSMSEPTPTPPEGWSRVEGLPASFMETLLVDGDALYVGGQGRVYETQGNGRWTASPALPDGYEIASLVRADGRLLAGTYGGGVFEAEGSGRGWRDRSDGLTGAGAKTVLAMAARGPWLVVGTGGASLFRRSRTDPGASWQPFRTGVPWTIAGNTSALALVGDRLAAGAGGNGFVYLNDGDDEPWRGVSYDPNVGAFLVMHDLLDTSTSLLGGGTYRLYRSTDAGETWSAIDLNRGLLSSVRFARSDGVLVALASKGPVAFLYRSVDDGQTWRQIDELRGVEAFDVVVYRDRLYLARLDGLWSIPLDEIDDNAR